MKRIASAVLVILVVALTSTTIFGQASVPNLVNFQGRLLDGLGNPVADGAHNLIFALFSVPSGGSSVWSEPASVTTQNGLFTYQLGSTTPFSQTLFQTYDSLFLQITVEGEVIAPRTLLTSTPFTRLANNLEMRSSSNDTVGIATIPSIHNLIVFGTDGARNVEMGGSGFGEIWLKDGTPSNNLIVDLTATTNSGGTLLLKKSGGSAGVDINAGIAGGGSTLNMRNDVGSVTVSFDADGSGNSAALLPTSSVSSIEILDEPGVAHEFNYGSVALSPTTVSTDTVTIIFPTPGFAVITAYGFFSVSHVNGTFDYVRASIDTLPGSIDFNNFVIESWDAPLPSLFSWRGFSLTKVHSVSAGAQTYYLNAGNSGVTSNIERRHLTVQFFPTAYGTVVNTIASKPSPTETASLSSMDPSGRNQQSEVRTITVEEHNARLQEELRAMQGELEARIHKLEAQINSIRKSAGAEE